jgi:adenosylcobinamide amidohydrolase
MVAGAGSTFSAIIRLAGGHIPDGLSGSDSFIPLTGQLWKSLNPGAVVIRTRDREKLSTFFKSGPYRKAPAVINARIFDFPDGLVDQAEGFMDYFAAWLAGSLYSESFANPENLVRPQKALSFKPLKLKFAYVEEAAIVDSRILDFIHRTLVIRFKTPRDVLSTNDGALSEVLAVGNSYSPAPTWPIYHLLNQPGQREALYEALKIDKASSAIMGTGADLNNLVVSTKTEGDLTVTVLATAGVTGNALRAGSDVGAYSPPGTINLIILSNRKLSPGAMANAVIYATEAKTAALWSMDVRSVQTGLINPATGTGTDSVVVVSGEGKDIVYSGGHTKFGQLMSEAVLEAVKKAIFLQNGLPLRRAPLTRLQERGLYRPDLAEVLANPRYAGYLEMAFSLSDAYLFGQVEDLSSFKTISLQIASEVAGRPVDKLDPQVKGDKTPEPLSIALWALSKGARTKGN